MMKEFGFEKMYVIIDDGFEIEKIYPTESDVLKKIETFEKSDFGNLVVCKNPYASGKKIVVVTCNKIDCRIFNYKSL